MATQQSGHWVNGSHRRLPSSVYGYFDEISLGLTTWSEHVTACQPHSSAALARGRYSSSGENDSAKQNFMRVRLSTQRRAVDAHVLAVDVRSVVGREERNRGCDRLGT